MSVYFAIYFEDKNPIGKYPEYGFWFNYFVYEMPEYLVPKLNLQNIRIVSLTEEVASAWKFAGIVGDSIKVRDNTLPDKQIPKELREAYKPGKDKYYLTEKDFENATKFMKAIMMDMAHRGFEQAWNLTKPAWSKLYKGLPEAEPLYLEYLEHQKSYGKMLFDFQTKIENCSTVDECGEVLVKLSKSLNPQNYVAPIYGEENVQHTPKSET